LTIAQSGVTSMPIRSGSALVRSVSATAGRKAADNAVLTRDGDRSHRWQERSSRRAQSQPGLVLAISRRGLDPRRPIAHQAAREHLAVGLPHIAEHYMGEHWLASFAVLALDDEK